VQLADHPVDDLTDYTYTVLKVLLSFCITVRFIEMSTYMIHITMPYITQKNGLVQGAGKSCRDYA
jgi:hypothetical protein